MKNKIKLSIVTVVTLSSTAFGGGDFSVVTPYETTDEVKATQVMVEPVEEKVIASPKAVVVPVKKASPWYVGAGLMAARAKASNCEDITYGFMAKVGYDFSDYVGVEVRGARTNWDYEGGKIKHLGAFLKPQYPVSDELSLYGLAGYAKTSLGTKRNFSDSGLAYGIGLDYKLNEEFSLFSDYERLLNDAGIYDLDSLTLGISYKF